MSSSGGLQTAFGTVTVTGPFALPTRAVGGNTAMSGTDFALNVTTGAGAVTITLPAAPAAGRLAQVKKVDAGAGAVAVTPAAGTLDGAASQSLAAQNHGVIVQFDGANWFTIAEIAPTIL